MNKLINGSDISKIIKDEVKHKIQTIKDLKKPCLAVIILGDNAASHIYVKNKKIACEYVGIESKSYELPKETSQDELLYLIDSLNDNKDVNGILVQLPLPKHINEEKVLLRIDPLKDVDGFHPYNIGMLSTNNAILNPCTPAGCIELLKRKGVKIKGKNCLMIGRSNIVGKPLSMMLINESATVTIAHSKTENLKELSQNADIIIVAIGRANFLKSDMIKEGVIIIDVGINRLEDGNVCGDADFVDCEKKASLITPVPGGVGPMTIAMLMKNCLKAYEIQNSIVI